MVQSVSQQCLIQLLFPGSSGLLSPASRSLVSPAMHSHYLAVVSSSSAWSPPSFPQNVMAPPTSPFTLRLPASSAQHGGHPSAFVNSPYFVFAMTYVHVFVRRSDRFTLRFANIKVRIPVVFALIRYSHVYVFRRRFAFTDAG